MSVAEEIDCSDVKHSNQITKKFNQTIPQSLT